jgi:dienelactone hydrolase
MAHAIAARLRAHGFSHRVTLLAYPDGGHGVGWLFPYDPVRDVALMGATPTANQPIRAREWPRLLAFLRALG